MKKLIVILGQTASGKSELAVNLARKFNGEIISADSRQVYEDLDIGTAKITKKERGGISHHLLDVASPKKRFTIAQYGKLAAKAMKKIHLKNKVPIICGGTGFYIQAVVDGIIIPEVRPDWKLRKKLEKKSTEELCRILEKVDPKRAQAIDRKNPRRLLRAIEIVRKTKKPIEVLQKRPLPYPVLMIGIKKKEEDLKKKIEKRFFKWLKQGLLGEVKKLRKSGLSWKKIEEFGIHYRVAARHVQNKLNRKEMIEKSIKEIQNYAKRQMVWFKRDKRIYWVKNYREAEKLVKNFLR